MSIRHPQETAAHRECLLRGATVRYADHTVLNSVDLVVQPGDRLALVGDNGAGKSTLLGVLAGAVPVDSGERRVEIPGGCAFAEQHPTFPPDASVDDAVDHLARDMRSLEQDIAEVSARLATASPADLPHLLDLLSHCTDRFEARGGYELDLRIDKALHELGLGDVARTRPVSMLSGGQRARLALAVALSSKPELLLLDEPTNDLDHTALDWLSRQMAGHRGSLVIVSHDRELLDTVAKDIIGVDGGSLRRYGLGYQGYLRARESERQRQRRDHEEWQAELTRNQRIVDATSVRLRAIPRKQERAAFGHGAFRARSSDHGATSRIRQAKDRVGQLRAEPVPPPAERLVFTPHFPPSEVSGPLVSVAPGAVTGAGEPPLALTPTTGGLEIRAGERWLVTGPNGAGKTTLLRVLAREIGHATAHPGVRVAYVRQDISTPGGRTLQDTFAEAVGMAADDAADRLLTLGLFTERDLRTPVDRLSVGQQRRRELAVAVTVDSDIILLDEPTNHLSPDLVEQLEDALRDYTGAVVTVTHDRRWLNNAARVTPDRLLRYATATPTTTGGVLDTPSRLNSLS
ncbi:ABC-F family ATP-binding cassette domain-containing protein [Corynebacterium glyciniphilum]|uniref:ABC-F family ATP-binding cassette domain-containing protein n=1 Tax=Corynebacterium glyciniphilum TaxID=1404244 RepID=UPI003DA16D15